MKRISIACARFHLRRRRPGGVPLGHAPARSAARRRRDGDQRLRGAAAGSRSAPTTTSTARRNGCWSWRAPDPAPSPGRGPPRAVGPRLVRARPGGRARGPQRRRRDGQGADVLQHQASRRLGLPRQRQDRDLDRQQGRRTDGESRLPIARRRRAEGDDDPCRASSISGSSPERSADPSCRASEQRSAEIQGPMEHPSAQRSAPSRSNALADRRRSRCAALQSVTGRRRR